MTPKASVQVTWLLDADDHALLQQLGRGSAEAGLRRLVEVCRQVQREVVEAGGPVTPRGMRPIYRAEA